MKYRAWLSLVPAEGDQLPRSATSARTKRFLERFMHLAGADADVSATRQAVSVSVLFDSKERIPLAVLDAATEMFSILYYQFDQEDWR